MLWMHYSYLVGISHFAKYGANRPLIVWEMLTDVPKSPVPQWWGKWKSDPESTCRSGSPPKVNHFYRVTPLAMSAKFGRRPFPCSCVILFTEWHNEWHTERSHNLRLAGGDNSLSMAKYSVLAASKVSMLVKEPLQQWNLPLKISI